MYKFFKDEDGAGVIGYGATLSKAFEEAALAMFNLTADTSKAKPSVKIELECSAEHETDLFIEWMNEILREAVLHNLLFSKIKITSMKNLRIKGWAKGSKTKKEFNVEPTYERLVIGKEGKKFFAKCVVREF